MGLFDKLKKNTELTKPETDFKDNLLANLRVMAILDIIMIPDEEKSWLRIVNYTKQDNLEIYNIDNGSGDTLKIYILDNQILIKGFDHENELNQFAADEWNKDFFKYIYSGIPNELKSLLTEDDIDETTFVIWYSTVDNSWKQNEWKDNDGGKSYLLKYIRKNAEEWCDWAKHYYEKEIDVNVIKEIYYAKNVTTEQIGLINPEGDINIILNELNGIKKDIKIIPFISVNGIEFGTNREELWKQFGNPKRSFKKTSFSKVETDDYGCFHIYYDSNYNFEAIEVFECIDIFYNNDKLPKKYSELLAYFRNIYDDIEDEEDADGFISVKGSIGVFLYDKIDLSYDNDIDGILFGRKDYYIKQGDEA